MAARFGQRVEGPLAQGKTGHRAPAETTRESKNQLQKWLRIIIIQILLKESFCN